MYTIISLIKTCMQLTFEPYLQIFPACPPNCNPVFAIANFIWFGCSPVIFSSCAMYFNKKGC